jgi:hypothetical protein
MFGLVRHCGSCRRGRAYSLKQRLDSGGSTTGSYREQSHGRLGFQRSRSFIGFGASGVGPDLVNLPAAGHRSQPAAVAAGSVVTCPRAAARIHSAPDAPRVSAAARIGRPRRRDQARYPRSNFIICTCQALPREERSAELMIRIKPAPSWPPPRRTRTCLRRGERQANHSATTIASIRPLAAGRGRI